MNNISNDDTGMIKLKEGDVYIIKDTRYNEDVMPLIKIVVLDLTKESIYYQSLDRDYRKRESLESFNRTYDILEKLKSSWSKVLPQEQFYIAYDPIKPSSGGESISVLIKDYLEAEAWERLVHESEKDTLTDEKKYTLDEVEIIANAYSIVPVTKEDILWYFEKH